MLGGDSESSCQAFDIDVNLMLITFPYDKDYKWDFL